VPKGMAMRLPIPREPVARRNLLINASLILAVIIGVVLLLVGARWRSYTTREGKFTIEFPGRPWVTSQSVATPSGMVTAYDYRVVQLLHGATYEVGYMVANAAVLEMMGGGQIGNICDSAVNRMGGTVIEQQDLTGAGYTGREVKFKAPGYTQARLRVFLAGDRIYTLMVSPVPKRDGEARVGRFFNSFHLQP